MTDQLYNSSLSKGKGLPALRYNGHVIHERSEMLSLTDMWRAARSPENREPYNWARKEGAPFIEAVGISLNLPHEQVLNSKQGRNGGSWAHWQVALAYAKYLDHDFHMWCNSVVRAHMEGRPHPRQGYNVDAREVRLQLKHHLKIAKLVGLQDNQALLSANRATAAVTGFDTLKAMGVTHLPAPQQEALLTPSDLALGIGGISAKGVNAALHSLGYQRPVRDAKDRLHWEPTEKGIGAGAVMLDTGKRHGDGTPIRQLKWASSVLLTLREAVGRGDVH